MLRFNVIEIFFHHQFGSRMLSMLLSAHSSLPSLRNWCVHQCLPVSVEARLTEALVRCFSDSFQALADLKKTTVRVNAATDAAALASAAPVVVRCVYLYICLYIIVYFLTGEALG